MIEKRKIGIKTWGLLMPFIVLCMCVGCNTIGDEGTETRWNRDTEDSEDITLQKELEVIEDWDRELVSLLDRIGDCEEEWLTSKITQEQVRWNDIIDYVNDVETLKKNRCYVLASDLAQIEGEDFNMIAEPILFVDDQGTDEVYSFMEVDEERKYAKITFYRVGEIDSELSENTDGSFDVTSIDGSVKGTLTLYGHHGWNGANFIINEVIGSSVFEKGERVTFNLAY